VSPAFFIASNVLVPALLSLSPIFKSLTFVPKLFAASPILFEDSSKKEPILPKKLAFCFSFFGTCTGSKSELLIGLKAS